MPSPQAHEVGIGQVGRVVVGTTRADLDRRLGQVERQRQGRGLLLPRGLACLVPAAGQQVLRDGAEGVELVIALEAPGDSQHHRRPVVHARLEGAPGEHQAVEERDRQAGRLPRGQQAEQARARRAVEEHLVPATRVGHGQHERHPAVDDRHVSDEPGVEDGVQDGGVGHRLVRQALHLRAVGGARRRHRMAHASVSTERSVCSIWSNSGCPMISGGASWTTGSPRSSARQ